MSINFPNTNLLNGATHVVGAVTFTYNLAKTVWLPSKVSSGEGGVNVVASDTAPASPTVGDLWVNSTTFELYTYYNDGATSTWVEVSGGGGGGVTAETQTQIDDNELFSLIGL
jgi:hypothetical protein